MQDLIKQEQFELEVLDRLQSKKLLEAIVFCGGTMLRLCFGLNRFSVDLDFWMAGDSDSGELFKKIKNCLGEFYTIRDSADKFNTLLFELKSKEYPRSLKIEIRKNKAAGSSENTIAYSRYSNKQVFLRTVTLEEMMREKIEAFLERKEIRDAFDLEFLVKKGVMAAVSKETIGKVIAGIDSLKSRDYKVKLCSLLAAEERKYYSEQNFRILKMALQDMQKKLPDT